MVKNIALKITNVVSENRILARWVCIGSGIFSLLALWGRYFVPGAELTVWFTLFYAASFAFYVNFKEIFRWMGIEYVPTAWGQILGIAWFSSFILMAAARYAFTFSDSLGWIEFNREIMVVPEEMFWVCIEAFVLFSISGASKAMYKKKNSKQESSG